MKRNNFRITATQAVQLINRQNAAIIDIRATDSFRKGHIIDAVSLTSKEIMDGSKKIEKFKNKPVIIVCNAGIESQKIAALLLKQGYNAFSLSGGIRAWSEAELPLVKE
jgi:rhodanese-related sulfurtransferase